MAETVTSINSFKGLNDTDDTLHIPKPFDIAILLSTPILGHHTMTALPRDFQDPAKEWCQRCWMMRRQLVATEYVATRENWLSATDWWQQSKGIPGSWYFSVWQMT